MSKLTSSTPASASSFSSVSSECGASFVDGTIPSTVEERTATKSSSTGTVAASATGSSGAGRNAAVTGGVGAAGYLVVALAAVAGGLWTLA